MPLAQIQAYASRKGWTLPFVSSHGTTFAHDCGTDGGFMLTVFMRDGDHVYRTYNTTSRGVDRLLFSTTSSTLHHTDVRRTGRTRRQAGHNTQPTGRARGAVRDTLEDRFRPWAALA
jgi:predicted dithiol-disulfide oxidoreductase (DUF899 family)